MREQKQQEITLMDIDHHGIGGERKQGALNLLLLVRRVQLAQTQRIHAFVTILKVVSQFLSNIDHLNKRKTYIHSHIKTEMDPRTRRYSSKMENQLTPTDIESSYAR